MRLALCFALTLPWPFSAGFAQAAEPAEERLLLGFEDEDFARLGKAIKLVRKEGKTKRGKPYVAWEGPGGFAALGQWIVYHGNASQGQHALGISLVTNQQYITYSPTKFEIPPEPVFYYGLLNNPWAAANGGMFNTCGVFRRAFPMDWSDHDLFRLDAYGEVKQTIRIVLEDEEFGPPAITQTRRHLRNPPRPGRTALRAPQLRPHGLDLRGRKLGQVPPRAGG